MLADPDIGEPECLGLNGEATDQRRGGALAGMGEVDAKVHGAGPLVAVRPISRGDGVDPV